jgi:DNA polymerase-3 subunit alpha
MKRYLKLLKPNVFEDIIAMVALYRPGPMDWIPDFIARKHGEKEIKYLHPKLKPILENTYGVAVYQEQVMQIAQALAGFSLGEADVLRKAMGKKVFALIQEEKKKFIEGCVKNNIASSVAEKVFAYIEPFAGYGFNRSHAACYAMIGYQTAYLKAHFPAAFMAALLTSDQDNIDRIAIEVSECREMGMGVLPPNVNESFEEFAVIIDEETKEERIRFGLNAIKNVGHTVAHEIVEERKRGGKFKNLTDLIERVESKDLNKKSVEALAKVGALDDLGERNRIISSMDNILAHSKNYQKIRSSNQVSLFGSATISLPEIKMSEVQPVEKKQKLAWEKELIGLYISDHPVKEYQDYLNKTTVRIKNIDGKFVGKNISVGGVISKIQKIVLKNQQNMLFVTLEDVDGKMEILVFPKILETTGSIWEEEKMIIATGRISDKDGNFKLLAESAKIINQQEVEQFQRILATQKANETVSKPSKLTITLPGNFEKNILKKLSEYFNSCKIGGLKVYLAINGSRLETPFCIDHIEGLEDSLKSLVPESKIEVE